MIALTATANKETFKFILENISLDQPVILSSTPEKTNIWYSVGNLTDRDPELFLTSVVEHLKVNVYKSKRLIIFCRKRNDVEEVFDYLKSKLSNFKTYKERPFAMFHANTEEDIKKHVINSFSLHDGTVRVLVATIAFGLGVDCKNVHTIIHYGPPACLDDYFQESGRCGRDGLQSVALLLVYPHSMSTTVISEGMKSYCKNKSICRRKLLLNEFGETPTLLNPMHLCCDICSSNCKCKDICNNNMFFDVFYEIYFDKDETNVYKKMTLSDNARNELRNKLYLLRKQKTSNISAIHTSVDIISGFPYQAIEEIVDSAKRDYQLSDMEETSILDNSIFPMVKQVIDEIIEKFGDESTFSNEIINQNQVSDVLSSTSGSDSDIDFTNTDKYKPKILSDSSESE